MLLPENILNIAYYCDYFTTINLLEVFPQFDSDNFWEDKWKFMYPNEKSLQFFTNQDVFLMKERKNMVIIMYHNSCVSCGYITLYKNIIYEDDGSLNDIFEKYSNVSKSDLTFIPINVQDQFIILGYNNNKYTILGQFSDFDEAQDFISKDIMMNNVIKFTLYHIIDMDDMVTCFVGINMERRPHNDNYIYQSRPTNYRLLKYRGL